MASPEATRVERRGAAEWITLDTPRNRNALSAVLVRELEEHLERAMGDDDVRVVVLTGNGPAFCAGADLKSGGDVARTGPDGKNRFVSILKTLRHGPKPVICAVNGHAFGGGIGLVAACDVAVAAEDAKFAFSEVRIGAVPAMISVVVLPKLGEHQTMRLFLTGERFDARRALELDLLHRVVPAERLTEAVDEEVAAIAKGGPIAVGEAKRLVRTVARLPEDEAFAWAEARIAEIFASEEAAEGMAAFAQKRPPRWAAEPGGRT